jgi:hypothetical protein
MHDTISSVTSYGMGAFAMFASADIATYAAIFGIILVIVRIAGDVPRAIMSWRKLFEGDEHDNSVE